MYTKEERIKIVKKFIDTRSVTETQRRFRNFYGIKTGSKPDYKTVVDIVNRFQSRGSIHATATRQRDPPIRTQANIIGSFWFEDASGASENVDQFDYQPVIQMFVAELKRRGLWTQRARGFNKMGQPATPHLQL